MDDQDGLTRAYIPLAAMVMIGLPVAIGVGVIARYCLHLGFNVWIAMAMCGVASAASTRAAAIYRRSIADRDQRRSAAFRSIAR